MTYRGVELHLPAFLALSLDGGEHNALRRYETRDRQTDELGLTITKYPFFIVVLRSLNLIR
jgi:hypothetical protein